MPMAGDHHFNLTINFNPPPSFYKLAVRDINISSITTLVYMYTHLFPQKKFKFYLQDGDVNNFILVTHYSLNYFNKF